MVQNQRPTIILGLVSIAVGAVVVLIALYLGFYIEATPRAITRSAKGHTIAVPAVIAVVTGVATLVGMRHRWGLVVGCVAAIAAAVAVVLTVVIPSE